MKPAIMSKVVSIRSVGLCVDTSGGEEEGKAVDLRHRHCSLFPRFSLGGDASS